MTHVDGCFSAKAAGQFAFAGVCSRPKAIFLDMPQSCHLTYSLAMFSSALCVHNHIKGLIIKTYRDKNGDSGISAYTYGDDWIQVQFKGGESYEYQASKIGQAHIAAMKALADAGDGLNSYIMRNPIVKHGWSSKG